MNNRVLINLVKYKERSLIISSDSVATEAAIHTLLTCVQNVMMHTVGSSHNQPLPQL